ncbi:class Ib ribonucleoside-diphosphate reductase assembly flavoprotein NrdI [Corynebacterium coyleae]|uniref:class Ib ribonucleoside-diphosphate reductase assembly flavoprotein NrdI n=1 Tax=Corynebacterium coyleae TaxID=53374 RepID=UPI001CC93F65|nr:class Ib ribonucleoside-diphosphate reductase assembly flavoprotein NrdI [Corynebacterium coyleae]UBI09999.1 class Ib ribonucleoside-diphosphate reductase assembly flavoprotein NrdI [Corynebacterium coyleae]
MIVYWSGSGVTERIAKKYGGVHLNDYVPETRYTLIVPTYGSPRTGGGVPDAILQFLSLHGHCMDGVIGVGNTTFGEDFCFGAKDIATAFDVPLVTMIDMVPTREQAYTLNKIKEQYEEVS